MIYDKNSGSRVLLQMERLKYQSGWLNRQTVYMTWMIFVTQIEEIHEEDKMYYKKLYWFFEKME